MIYSVLIIAWKCISNSDIFITEKLSTINLADPVDRIHHLANGSAPGGISPSSSERDRLFTIGLVVVTSFVVSRTGCIDEC